MLQTESKVLASHSHHNQPTTFERANPLVSFTKQGSSQNVVSPSSSVHTLSLSPNTWNLSGSGFSEAETFYLWPKSGGFILLQLAYSEVVSMFPASHISLRVATPTISFFKSTSMSGNAFKSSHANSKIECGSFTLNKSITPQGQLVIRLDQKTNDYTFSITLTHALGDLTQVGDGNVRFGQGLGALQQTYGLKAHVQGHLYVGKHMCDLEGEGTTVHQYQASAPHKIADRWHFINYVSPDLSLVTISGVTPKSMQRDTFGTLVLRYKDPVTQASRTAVSSSLQLPFLRTTKDDDAGYTLPTQLQVQSELINDLQEPLTLTIQFSLLQTPFRIKVLNELPWLLRKATQVLFANPIIYHYLEPMQLHLSKPSGETIASVSGPALLEITYTNGV